MTPIPHSRPLLTAADAAAVAAVLAGPMVGQGRRTAELESSLADWVGAAGAVATASGSAAMQVALQALGAGPGTEVVLPTLLCRSVLEAVVTCGARPVPCDVGEDWVVTAPEVRARLTARTRAVVVPHVMGVFADVAAIAALGAPVIEDFAQALPLRGSRRLEGEAAVFSFHPTKCVTAGEGGATAARSTELVERMRAWRDGGGAQVTPRVFSPLSDVAAALAASQLAQYPGFLGRRRQIAECYWQRLQPVAPGILRSAALRGTCFRFGVVAPGGVARVASKFAEQGITVRSGVDTLLHRFLGLPDAEFPCAVGLYRQTVSLPIYPALTDEELERCAMAAAGAFAASRSESPEILRQ